eukprot:5289496-Pyramimonas_sp.AAC.1
MARAGRGALEGLGVDGGHRRAGALAAGQRRELGAAQPPPRFPLVAALASPRASCCSEPVGDPRG